MYRYMYAQTVSHCTQLYSYAQTVAFALRGTAFFCPKFWRDFRFFFTIPSVGKSPFLTFRFSFLCLQKLRGGGGLEDSKKLLPK